MDSLECVSMFTYPVPQIPVTPGGANSYYNVMITFSGSCCWLFLQTGSQNCLHSTLLFYGHDRL